MLTYPIAFLFDPTESSRPGNYGSAFDPAFLRGLSSSDPAGETHSSILRGDVMLYELASLAEPIKYQGRYPATRRTVDATIFAAVASDLVDDLRVQWNTVDLDALAFNFVSRNIYCLSLLLLSSEFRERIDRYLRRTAGYLGAVEFDLGHPIERFAFAGCLPECAVIFAGSIFLECNDYEDCWVFDGAESFKPGGRQLLNAEEFEAVRPNIGTPDRSVRGCQAVERYKRRVRITSER